jgi:N-formylglutamate deformylase
MPAVAASHATDHPGLVHPDFVLGDRDGTTASPRLAGLVAHLLRSWGYSVAINHPYKGVELVRRYSDPAVGRHSLQLEINRKLYMNEHTLALEPGSERLQHHLRGLATELLKVRPSDLA